VSAHDCDCDGSSACRGYAFRKVSFWFSITYYKLNKIAYFFRVHRQKSIMTSWASIDYKVVETNQDPSIVYILHSDRFTEENTCADLYKQISWNWH
jgi:hypothetical protein